MEFYDEVKNPPPAPPPPPPAMPYSVEALLYASAGPGSPPKEWPQKTYADGRRELMSEDEIGIWRRVQWLSAALATPPTEPAPELPYEAKTFVYGGLGVTRERLAKVKPNDYSSELLSSDEIATWEFLQVLEARFKAVQVERELSVLDGPLAPPVAAADPLTDLNASSAETLSDPITLAAPSEDNAAVPEELPHVNIPPAEPPANSADPGPANTATADDKKTRAIAELLADPTASNPVLAERAGCSDEYIRRLRHQLVSEGRLPAPTPAVRREGGANSADANTPGAAASAAVGAPPTA